MNLNSNLHQSIDFDLVETLNQALWRPGPTGGAALMVGAGLSKNAVPSASGMHKFPDWKELVSEVIERLYPMPNNAQYNSNWRRWREKAQKESEETSGFLRIAEQFKARFGDAELNLLLNELIPDGLFQPSILHDRLINLPWSDIFTTNWDTLLERSAASNENRRYNTMLRPDQLSTIPAPRIVKLHGTLRLTANLVFSEEDFRRYPVDYAPFVNLVRQTMLEKVVCLIGFSGSDPNFLHWAGWVRDVLSKHANKVILCGLLDLSPAQYAYLQNMHVLPLDLSPFVNGGINTPNSHVKALEEFLFLLENGGPFIPTFWPEKRRQSPGSRQNPPEHEDFTRTDVDPTPAIVEGLTKLCVFQPENQASKADTPQPSQKQEIQKDIIDALANVRRQYPGWVVLPFKNRGELQAILRQWLKQRWKRDFDEQRDDNFDLRVNLLREIAWRAGVCLSPLPSDFAAAIRSILAHAKERGESGKARTELAFALLRHRRCGGELGAFSDQIDAIEQSEVSEAESLRLLNERALAWLTVGDFDKIDAVLRDYPNTVGDAYFIIRKAALLTELGRIDEALDAALSGLRAIQIDTRSFAASIMAQSREGWAGLLIHRLCHAILNSRKPEDASRGKWKARDLRRLILESEERMEKLSAERCNAEDELERSFAAVLSDETAEAAWRYAALIETAGLPLVCGGTEVVRLNVMEAARRMAQVYPARAAALLLRAAADEPTLRKSAFFNPTATINWGEGDAALAAIVELATENLRNAVGKGLQTSGDGERGWARVITGAILLRAVAPTWAAKADKAAVESWGAEMAGLAGRLCGDPVVLGNKMRPHKLAELYAAVVGAALAAGVGAPLLDLADLPIPEYDLTMSGVRLLPEPLAVLAQRQSSPLPVDGDRLTKTLERLNTAQNSGSKRAEKRIELLGRGCVASA